MADNANLFPGASSDELKSLEQSLGSYRRNIAASELLGQPTTGQAAPGPLSRFLDIIGRPGRAIEAGLFTAAGANVPELAGLTPQQAALQALQGKLRIGAGELPGLRMSPQDSLLERLAKGAGAFGIDVALDPITWVGAPASIGRKAAAELAVRKADDILNITLDVASKNKRDTAPLIDELFGESDLGRLALEQKRIGAPALPDSPLTQIRTTADGSFDPSDVRRLAAEGLAKRLGDALTTRGRAGVLDELTKVTGSRAAALQAFSKLPDPIRGGVSLVNPITGAPLLRLTSGTSDLGKAGERINEARFQASQVISPLTGKFSGKAGAIRGQYLKDLAAAKRGEAPKFGTTLTSYVKGRDLISREGLTDSLLNVQSRAALARAIGERDKYTGADINDFNDAFSKFFALRDYPITGEESAAFLAGRDAGLRLRQYINDRHGGAIGEDVRIGDLGDDWSTLAYSDEYADYVTKNVPQGRKDVTDNYQPQRGRSKEMVYIADPEERAALGYEMPGQEGITALSGVAANRRLVDAGKMAKYEVDPIKIAEKYLRYLDRTVSHTRMLKEAYAAGILVKDNPLTRMILDSTNAAVLSKLTDKLSPAAAAKIRAIAGASRRKLSDLTSERSVTEMRAAVTRRINETETAYTLAKQNEQKAINSLDAISEELVRLRARAAQASNRLQAYARSGIEENVMLAEQAARRVRQRVSRANARLDDVNANIQAVQADLVANPGDAYLTKILRQLQTDGRSAVRDLRSRAATKAQAESQLYAFREQRKAMGSEANAQEQEVLNRFEDLLTKQQAAASELEAARTLRRSTRNDFVNAREASTLEDMGAVDSLADAYSAAIQAKRMMATSPVGIAITKALNKQTPAFRKAIKEGSLPAGDLDAFARAAGVETGDVISYVRSRAAVSETKKALYSALKYTGRKRKNMTVDQLYAKSVVNAAENLAEEEFAAVRLVANNDKLGSLIAAVADNKDYETTMRSMEDIYRIWSSARSVLSKEDIETLGLTKKDIQFMKSNVKQKVFKNGTVLETEFGKALNAAGMSPSGSSGIKLPSRFNNTFSPVGVRKALEEMYHVQSNPSQWEHYVKDIFDPLLLLWKTSVTVGRGPGYAFTNLAGGLANNYLAGVGTAAYKNSIRQMQTFERILKKAELDNPALTYAEVMAKLPTLLENAGPDGKVLLDFIDRGGYMSTDIMFTSQQIARAGNEVPLEAFGKGTTTRTKFDQPRNEFERRFQTVVNFGLTNPFQRVMNDLNQKNEMFMRLSAFNDGLRKFDNADAAMDRVYMLHFNYQDLGPGEQWARRIFPFYTWSRNNIPLQFRIVFTNPGIIERISRANDAIRSAFEADPEDQWLNDLLPEYVMQGEGYVSRFTGSTGEPIVLRSVLPTQDLNKTFMGAGPAGIIPVPRLRELGNMLSPFISAPISFVSGVDLATGRSFDPRGAVIPGYLAWLKNIPGATTMDSEGNHRISDRGMNILTELVPQLGIGERAVSGVPGLSSLASENARVRGLTNLLNTLGIPQAVGMGASTLESRTVAGELRSRTRRQQAALENLAAQQGLDLDQIREMVRNQMASGG